MISMRMGSRLRQSLVFSQVSTVTCNLRISCNITLRDMYQSHVWYTRCALAPSARLWPRTVSVARGAPGTTARIKNLSEHIYVCNT